MSELARIAQEDPEEFKRRINGSRRRAFFEGYIEGVSAMLNAGDVVLDIGAGLGDLTDKFAQSNAHILAYEADPVLARHLETKMAIYRNVSVVPLAISNEANKTDLYRVRKFDPIAPMTALESSIIPYNLVQYVKGSKITVSTESIETVMNYALEKHGDIAFMNLDIMGSELEVLEALIENDLVAKIRLIVVKTYENLRDDQKGRYKNIREQMALNPEWNIFLEKA